MSYSSIDGLEARIDHGILRFTLDRPAKRNALDDAMVGALIEHLDRANQDEAVRAILLDSSSDDFCTGFDVISRNAAVPSRSADVTSPGAHAAGQKPRVGSIQRRVPSQAHRLIPLMLSTQVPIVCAVRGWAAGLGLHLALASDFCIAARDARLWEPFTERGFTPDSGGTWLLPRLVGMARAKELLLLGTELSGEDAASWGLVHRAVDAGDTSGEAGALARRLADGPTVALGLTKWLLHQGAGLDLERHLANEALALELSSRSSDFREGMTALREKREPGFEGR